MQPLFQSNDRCLKSKIGEALMKWKLNLQSREVLFLFPFNLFLSPEWKLSKFTFNISSMSYLLEHGIKPQNEIFPKKDSCFGIRSIIMHMSIWLMRDCQYETPMHKHYIFHVCVSMLVTQYIQLSLQMFMKEEMHSARLSGLKNTYVFGE